MSEVLNLNLHYNASMESGSLLVRLDAVETYTTADGEEKTRVVIGPAQPQREWNLEKLAMKDPERVAAFREFLMWLHDVTREQLEVDLSNPEAVQREVARAARERHLLVQEQARHAAIVKESEDRTAALAEAITKGIDQKDAIDKALAVKLEEHAALDRALEEKRAALTEAPAPEGGVA